MKSALKFMIVFSFTLLISACGEDEKADPVTVSGIAAKGIIINGVVTAYPIVNGQIIKNTIIGTAVTDSTGKYTLTISPSESVIDLGAAGSFTIGGDAGYSGPLFIVVSPDTLGASQMKCDAKAGCGDVAFGETVDLSFSMESVVPSVTPGMNVQASITPLTNMAAAAAKKNGLGKDGIEAANKKIATMFGVSDIINTNPVDVTDETSVSAASADDLKNAYIASAVASLAQKDYSGDIDKTLSLLNESYNANNGELIQNEGEGVNSTAVISLAELTQAAVDNINSDSSSAADTDVATAVSELQNLHDNANDESKKDTPTETTVDITSEDIDAAKEIVTAVNSWTTQLEELEKAADTFGDNLDAAGDVSEAFMDSLGDALGFTIEAMVLDYIEALKGETGPFELITHADDDSNIRGQGTIDINTSNRTVSVTDALVIAGETENKVTLGFTMPQESGTSINAAITANSVIKNTHVSLTVSSGTAAIHFEKELKDLYEREDVIVDVDKQLETNFPSGLDLDFQVRLEQLEAEFENPFYFEGQTKISGFRGLILNDTENDDDNDLTGLRFSQVVSSGDIGFKNGEKITATFTANMENASTWSPDSQAIGNLPELNTVKSDFATYSFSTDKNTMHIKMVNDEEFYIRLKLNDGLSGFKYIQLTEVNFVGNEDTISSYYSSADGANLLEVLNNEQFVSFGENSLFEISFFSNIDIFIPGEGDYETRFSSSDVDFSAEGGTFNGVLVEQDPFTKEFGESPDNYRKLNATMDFVGDFLTEAADLPPANITLTAKRTGVVAAEVSASAKYDNIELIFSIAGDASNGAKGLELPSLVVIDSNTAARLTVYPDINDEKVTGNVIVNGNGIASIEGTTSGAIIVRYINGEIQSLDF